MNKLEIEVTYVPELSELGRQMEDFMRSADLGVDGIAGEQTDIVTITTTTPITNDYVDKVKTKLIKVYNEQGNEVLNIKVPVL